MLAKIPCIIRKIYPRRIWKGPKGHNTVYLTFDDGPIPEITPWVLRELKKHKVKATFFCIGDNIRKHPEIFAQVVGEQHSVGNHTFNHLNGWKTSVKKYLHNVEKAQEILEYHEPQKNIPSASLHSESRELLFRPPYGRITSRQARILQKRGFTIVMWDVISGDFSPSISPDQCYKNVINKLSDGSIIVFHDSVKAEKNLKATLPAVLESLKRRGYRCQKL